MTTFAEPPVLDQPNGRRRWPLVTAAAILVAAGGVVVAIAGSPVSSLGAKFLSVSQADTGYHAYLSMDGTHDGAVTSGGTTDFVGGCVDGQAMLPGNYDGLRSTACEPTPADWPDAPTTESGMLAYLQQYSVGNPDAITKNAEELAEFRYMGDDARRALIEVAHDDLYIPEFSATQSGSVIHWDVEGSTVDQKVVDHVGDR